MRLDRTSKAKLLARALQAAQQGRLMDAEAGFRRILAADAAHVEAKFGLATVFALTGKAGDAIALFGDVVRANPEHTGALLNLGNARLQLGDIQNAEQSFRRVLKLKPDSMPARFGLGCALQQQGNVLEAERCYRDALPAFQNDARLWMNLATAQRHLGKLAEAVGAYRRAVQLNPGLVQAWSALGQTLLDTQQLPDASEAFRRATQLAPENAEAVIGLGDVHAAQCQDEQALACYMRATTLDPASQNAQTKAESLLLKRAGSEGPDPLFDRLAGNRIYATPSESRADALALLDAYRYPDPQVLNQTRSFLESFEAGQLHPRAWWKAQLSGLGPTGQDKVLRGICSALYSWSAPTREAIEAIAEFAADGVVHSFGAGTGYWEWLLEHHCRTRVLASDRILRHRYIEMAEEDYGTAVVGEREIVFLAWIPRGVDAVMNLLDQMRPGQKLVLIGEGTDPSGKARICATEAIFQHLEAAYERVGTLELGCYSYIRDDVRLYQRIG